MNVSTMTLRICLPALLVSLAVSPSPGLAAQAPAPGVAPPQAAPPQAAPPQGGAPPGQGRPGGPGAPPGAPPAAALPPLTPAAIERAGQILAEARAAMGGDKLAAITSVVATGRTNRVRGNNLVPIEFEIAIQMPDKYLRKDEVPAEESEPTSTGFNGGDIIQLPLPAAPGARPGGPPPPPNPQQVEAQRRARMTAVKQDFARLTLGMLANSTAAYPLTFGYAAQAAAPQGTADVLDVRGDGNFAVRLFINSQTRLPIMISWQAPPTGVVVTTPGQPPPATIAPGAVVISAPAPPAASASQQDKEAYTKEVAALRQKAQTTPVEYRLYYADYREVDGVKFPFRLRRAIGPDTTEETTFDRFRLNTKIDPRKFALTK
jgi:hypothetical protein